VWRLEVWKFRMKVHNSLKQSCGKLRILLREMILLHYQCLTKKTDYCQHYPLQYCQFLFYILLNNSISIFRYNSKRKYNICMKSTLLTLKRYIRLTAALISQFSFKNWQHISVSKQKYGGSEFIYYSTLFP